jgi:hypothetical protein
LAGRGGLAFGGVSGDGSGRGGRSPPLAELQDIVGDSDKAPLAGDLFEAAQQELTKAARLPDLSEHRLGQLPAQAIGAFVAAGLDLLAHRGDARAPAFSFSRVLGPSRFDVGVDHAFLQRRKVGVGAIAGVGRQGCGGLRPRLALIASTIGVRLMLIALFGVEPVGDDHLPK